ncbi:MAG: N-acetylglucosamine-6-phosphate deacetylase [Bryobacterales bacterium]|nr:N-acetylglucosamine-6-phosphate deacetylase [Bryobacterales bacterium]
MICSGRLPGSGAAVRIEFESRIAAVSAAASEEAGESFLAPGWIDLQVNGFAGVDYNDAATPHEEIGRSIRALRATGVTRFFPTVITGPFERMAGALANLAAARARIPEGESIEGLHLEGPYISPEEGPRGAHPREWVRPPDLDEFERLQEAAGGLIRLVTLAPEWPGAVRFIRALVNRGIVVSIGHTQAAGAQIRAAADAGATMSTHLGNGAAEMLSRRANYLWEQLAEDRLTAGFIVDGVHLDTPFLKVALRAKGLERSLLVTDAAAPAGCEPGSYRLGALDVVLTAERRILLAGSRRLAASALSMDLAAGNLMQLAGLTLAEAVTLATVNPARAARIEGRQAGLVPGDRADLVQFRNELHAGGIRIEKVFVGGNPCDTRSR